jgi:heme a synthase
VSVIDSRHRDAAREPLGISSTVEGASPLTRRVVDWLGDPITVRRIAFATVVCYALLVLTGGAVRLTGSGLGCADWPNCFQGRLIARASFHSEVEFANRVVTVAVSVVTAVAFVATGLRHPRQRSLLYLSGALVAGLIAQIVLGGLVVLTKLNPYLVALHFALTILMLAVALCFFHLSGAAGTRRRSLVGPEITWLSRLLVGALAVVTCAGTIVTGSGPHAGGSDAKRVPIAFRDIAELHSTIALFLIGLTLATLFTLHVARAPARTQRVARTMLEVFFIQGTLGYTQYFLHDAAVVIEFHLAGATAAWIAAVTFYLSLHEHVVELPAENEASAVTNGDRTRMATVSP